MIHAALQALYLHLNRVHLAVFGGRTERDAVFVADQLRDLGISAIEFLLILPEIYASAPFHRQFLQHLIGFAKNLLYQRPIFPLPSREVSSPWKISVSLRG